jgi:hypothetical protein
VVLDDTTVIAYDGDDIASECFMLTGLRMKKGILDFRWIPYP